MSVNDFDGLPTTTRNQGKDYHFYQQLGAPTLVYEGSRSEDSAFRVPSHNLPFDNNRELQETFKRRNRVRARWQYGLDVNQLDSVVVPPLIEDRRSKCSSKSKALDKDKVDKDDTSACAESMIDVNDYDDDEGENTFEMHWVDREQQRNRLSLLLEDDMRVAKHKDYIQNYAAFQHPYVKVDLESLDRKRKASPKKPKIDLSTYAIGQEFHIGQKIDSDPSYLAPFDFESIYEATHDGSASQKKVGLEPPERPPQGNALLCAPCPCCNCSKNNQGYVMFHPKGPCLERLCVSNLVPPITQDNAGDIRNTNISMIINTNEFHWKTMATIPNEICLDDTILEIRQCGAWNTENQKCIFAVRTGTHISVIEVICQMPDLDKYNKEMNSFPESACWGNYILEEKERIDLRSFSPKLPSFRPVSLTSHPRYGNGLTPSKFAFASHSVGSSPSSTRNVVHNCTYATDKLSTKRHDIANLKFISIIDFNARNPMCLWSAASSHIRPALAPGAISKMQRQTKSPFGVGSSLFSIDLRTNSASFQWSPSAEEMTTEGVHSINGILTDWTRENTVYVTSSSAGKTYEIDGRMPCRAVNAWSLTSVCEESQNIVLSPKGFFGEPSLLTKPVECVNSESSVLRDDSPIIKVNTDCRTSGIHLFQKPLRKPRFQTDSLECVGIAGLDKTGTASIATSSYFDLIDVSDDVFTCGISSIRLPINQFVGKKDNVWTNFLEQRLDVLCALTMNDKGDIYCHSLLECNNATVPDKCRRFDGLPIGSTAINIPTEIDGRTKLLKNGHWKPTGGMHLNLFFSNTYPIPQNSLISSSQEVDDHGSDKGSQEIILGIRKKNKRIDESADVIQIEKRTKNAALTIRSHGGAECHNQMLRDDGKDQALIMPLSLSQNVQRTTMVYEGSDGHESDETSRSTDTGTGQNRSKRTDLSKSVIESTLDDWDDIPSESEATED